METSVTRARRELFGGSKSGEGMLFPVVLVLGNEDSDEGGTGGKGSITQWVHAEYMVGSETICPTFTQWVRGGYFPKVTTKVPTG